jgi:SAM-dependent methyltransferase
VTDDPRAPPWSILACPRCRSPLSRESTGARCACCGGEFPRGPGGQLDLRLPGPKHYSMELELGGRLEPPATIRFEPLALHPDPEVDWSHIRVPRHLSHELLSHLPRATRDSSIALDLGCGDGRHREVCEQAGFRYVGLDWDSPGAGLWGDAHALPFQDGSVELVLAIALLEHVRHPEVVAREVRRILQPRGRWIGTVAFLEPFHDRSYFHHTHLGLAAVLLEAGFEVDQVAPSPAWTVLRAQASLALFPRLPRPLARALVAPLDWLHRGWWRALYRRSDPTARREPTRLLKTSGAFTFLAQRP